MQVVYKMFCSNHHIGNNMVSSKKDMFVLINWLCSLVVLFTLPHLLAQHDSPLGEGETCTADATANTSTAAATSGACLGKDDSNHNSFGSLLGFTSVSYLVGYFGILLAMKEQDRRSKHMHDTGTLLASHPSLSLFLLASLILSLINKCC